jgi:exopolysaccharide production protein ExoZ
MKSNKEISAVLPTNKNLQLIQVLRGAASLFVVLFHATINFPATPGRSFLFGFFGFGYAGVDIFFVLSGFIITYTSIRWATQRNQLLPFIRRRCIRIFPSYWIIISLFLILQLLLPAFYKTHYSFTLPNFIATWFLLPGHTMVNGVSWTLSYELFFYLLFSLVFLLPSKKWTFTLFALYILVIVALPFLENNPANRSEWQKLLTDPMNIEFFMGVMAALLIPYIPQQLSLPFIITGGLLFLTAGILTDHQYYLLSNGFNRIIIFGVPSFLIIAGLVRFELNKKINVHNILLSLGEASYSLYLLHLPLIAAAVKLMTRLNIQNNIIFQLLLLVIVGITCYGSILFYKWIEKPIIGKLNRLGKTGHTKSLEHKQS